MADSTLAKVLKPLECVPASCICKYRLTPCLCSGRPTYLSASVQVGSDPSMPMPTQRPPCAWETQVCVYQLLRWVGMFTKLPRCWPRLRVSSATPIPTTAPKAGAHTYYHIQSVPEKQIPARDDGGVQNPRGTKVRSELPQAPPCPCQHQGRRSHTDTP